MLNPSLRLAVIVVFFLSGATALVYQVVWMRQLSIIFGASAYAVTTVLATFMTGLALGSWLFSRRTDRLSKLLPAYAALELGIGLSALAVPLLIPTLREPYTWLRQLDLSFSYLVAARSLLAGAVLLIPTVLMGGTLPILVRLLVHAPGDVGRATGLLYFVNTAGAVVGCFAAGFYLLENLGLRGTTYLAASVNLGLAITAAIAGRFAPDAVPASSDADDLARDPGAATVRVAYIALFCIGLSGFTALAYEVLWTRALLRYLHNSTYAFTTMLVAFLAGIALGSWLYTLVRARFGRSVVLFAALETGVGLGFAGSALLFGDLPSLSLAMLGADGISSFGDSLLLMFIRASLILLPPAVLLGATVPLATAICSRGLSQVARSVGLVYAVNTVGAILGTIAATFILIPQLGMGGTLMVLVLLNVAIGVALFLIRARSRTQLVITACVAAVILAGVVGGLPVDVFRQTMARGAVEIVYYGEGATDNVAVLESNGQRAIVYSDQRATAATWSYPWNFFLGHLPLLLHQGEPERGLHICFGVGNSLSAMLTHDSLERVDSVELSPHVIEAAQYFWTNDDVINDPKVRTIIDDGRVFAMTSNDTYDVIAIEPPFVFTSGVINLYTREFYQDIAQRLAPDGIFLQWIQVGQATLDDERMLFRAFLDVFPHATAWQQLAEDGPILLIGTHQPLSLDYQLLQSKMNRPRVKRDLDMLNLRSVPELLSMLVFDEHQMADFVGDALPVTDDRTVLDFSMPRYAGSGFGLGWGAEMAANGDVINPMRANLDRGLYYWKHRGSALPLIHNLGDSSRAEIAAQVAEIRRARIDTIPKPVPEDEWRR